MSVLDLESRKSQIDYSDDDVGKESGAGTFGHGTIRRRGQGEYLLDGASEDGYRFQTVLTTVKIGYQEELDLGPFEEFDVGGLDFRVGGGEMSLRTPPE